MALFLEESFIIDVLQVFQRAYEKNRYSQNIRLELFKDIAALKYLQHSLENTNFRVIYLLKLRLRLHRWCFYGNFL